MMKKLLLAPVLLLALLIGLVGCSGKGAMPKEFSAESVSKFGGKITRAKMFVSGKKWRVESSAFGRTSIMIARQDKNKVYIIMPQQKMYMEQKLDPKQVVSMSGKVPGEIERTKVGTDKVNGVMCDKFKVTYKPSEQSPKITVFQWIGKNNIPMKSAAVDGSWSSEMKNVKIGKQPAKLFELPSGYKKFEMPKMKF
jgi:Domain of unknown function (DUF4412)